MEANMSCNVEAHKMHMCQLKSEGKFDIINSISDKPVVQCRQCGDKANNAKFLCAAHLKEDAPNVEGGHGSVGFEDTGKPHSG
jgi:hypothetical protein